MLRRLLTLLSAVSLLLGIATCVLWVRSYWVGSLVESHVYWNGDGRGHRAEYWGVSCSGRLCFVRSHLWTDDPEAARMFAFAAQSSSRRWGERPAVRQTLQAWYDGFELSPVAGFAFRWDEDAAAGDLKISGVTWSVALPYWAVAALFAPLPVGWLVAAHRSRVRQRLVAGQCVRCGYDLRATPERCPDCGAMPAAGGARS